jgi:hypothetical protein
VINEVKKKYYATVTRYVNKQSHNALIEAQEGDEI